MTARSMPAVAVLLTAALLGGGCAGGSGRGGAAPTPTIAVAEITDPSEIPEDVEAKGLVEPKPRNETEELIQRSARIYDFCAGWDALDRIPEPDPADVDELLDFSILYYDTIRYIDTTRKVQERVPAERGRPERVKPVPFSEEAAQDLDTLRKRAFEYRVRVGSWKSYFDQGVFDRPELQRRLDKAFELFAAEEVTTVHDRLAEYEKEHCDL